MKTITALELKRRIESGEDIQVIDVREEHEVKICSIGGEHLPMGMILDKQEAIRRDCDVIIHCRSGKRSQAVITMLENKFDFDNLFNLNGGIMAWAKDVDNQMEIY